MDLKEIVYGWSGFSWLRIRTYGPCEYGNKPSGSIKDEEFLDQELIRFSGILLHETAYKA
jgi:hypothetical protein